MKRSLSRRGFLSQVGVLAGAGLAGGVLAGCSATPQVVEKEIVKEVVVTAAPEPMALDCRGHVTLGYYTSTTPAIERMKAQEASFHDKAPDVDLEIIQMTSIYDKYATMMAAGNEPNVIWMGTGFWRFVGGGAFMDLNPLVEADTGFRKDDYYPECLDYFTWQDKLYALPYGFDTDIYGYNEELFTAEGIPFPEDDWTHDDYVMAGQALTKDTDGDGRIDQYGVSNAGWYQYVWESGGDILSPDLDHATMDTPEAIEGLQLYYDLTWGKYQIAPTPDTESEMGVVPMFTNGRIGVRITGPYHIPVYREAAEFGWNVVSAPNQKGTWFNPEGYIISARTKDKGAAWCLLKHLCDREAQETFYLKEMSAVPTIKAVAESDAFLNQGKPPANIKAYIDALAYEKHVPKHPVQTEMWTIMAALVDQLAAGELTAEEVGQQATAELNAKLREYEGIWAS